MARPEFASDPYDDPPSGQRAEEASSRAAGEGASTPKSQRELPQPTEEIEFDSEFRYGNLEIPRTVVIASPNVPTLSHLTAVFANETKWRLRVAHTPQGLEQCVQQEDVRLAIADERWLDDQMVGLLHGTGSTEIGTLFAPVLSGASVLEAYSWLKRGATAFIHEPMKEIPKESLDLVLKSALRALTLPLASLDHVEVSAPTKDWVEFAAPSYSAGLEQFLRFFAMLYSPSLSADERRMLHLVINEIGMNAIEWGNQHDSSRRFRVAYAFYPSKVLLCIEDEGAGFDPSEVPDPTKDPAAVLAMRQAQGKRLGGYGLVLARNIMDKVEYNARGNICYMEKVLTRSPSKSRRSRTISAKIVDDGSGRSASATASASASSSASGEARPDMLPTASDHEIRVPATRVADTNPPIPEARPVGEDEDAHEEQA